MKGTPPSSRYAHACVNYRSKVVVFGGCEIGKGYSSAMMPTLNDVHVLEVGSQPKSRELKRGPPQLPKDLAFLVNSEQFSDVVFIGTVLSDHVDLLTHEQWKARSCTHTERSWYHVAVISKQCSWGLKK